ncbi:iron chaperone [Streptomyces sp. NPDC004609]|uniref:iron chaperone n=1 Tax=Streptomyces sp. NPDC004609 TaxID=3364704 RepID=UPI0036AEAA15
MVQSAAPDVDGYLAEVTDEGRRTALARIRELCRTELAGYEELMAYGMPAYRRPGAEQGEIAFANQKQYISFYLLRVDVREAFEDRLAGHDMGKGCLRFRRIEKIDYDLVRDLLRATAAATEAGPGRIC